WLCELLRHGEQVSTAAAERWSTNSFGHARTDSQLGGLDAIDGQRARSIALSRRYMTDHALGVGAGEQRIERLALGAGQGRLRATAVICHPCPPWEPRYWDHLARCWRPVWRAVRWAEMGSAAGCWRSCCAALSRWGRLSFARPQGVVGDGRLARLLARVADRAPAHRLSVGQTGFALHIRLHDGGPVA